MPDESVPESKMTMRLRETLHLVNSAREQRLPQAVSNSKRFEKETGSIAKRRRYLDAALMIAERFLPWDSNFEATGLHRALQHYVDTYSRIGTMDREGVAEHCGELLLKLPQLMDHVLQELIQAFENALISPDGIRWLKLPAFAEIAQLRTDLLIQRDELNALMDRARMLDKSLTDQNRFQNLGKQSDHFRAAAENARCESQVWIGILGMAIATLLIYIYLNFHALNKWPEIVPRAMIATIGYSCIYWCFRNYAAAKHNETVNQHRANSLETMRHFLLTETATDTRTEILSQATLSAFGQQPSGFIGGESVPDVSRIINNLQSGPAGKS